METLAFIYAAVAHEDPNSERQLRKSKNTGLKVSCSSAIALVTSCVVSGTIATADPVQATVHYGNRGHDVKKLQSVLGGIPVDGIFGSQTLARLKSYQAKHGLAVDGIAGNATLSSLGLPTSPQNRNTQLERYAKLKLINDTPYMAIITLHDPEQEQPSKYAYIPPCSERTLLNTYSSSWKVSFNGQEQHSIGKFFEQNTFQVKTYQLLDSSIKKEAQNCEYKQQAEEINALKEVGKGFVGLLKLGKNAPKTLAETGRFIARNVDDMSRVGVTPTSMRTVGQVNFVSLVARDGDVAAKLVKDPAKVTRYHQYRISQIRNRYRSLKEAGQESLFDFKYVKDELEKVNADCINKFGFSLFDQPLTKEIFDEIILSFNDSMEAGQTILSVVDKTTRNNYTLVAPKAQATATTLLQECVPVAGQ